MIHPEDDAARREALETWTRDRAQLVFTQPLVANLALQLEIIPVVDERLPTAATDGRAVYVNPYFLRGMSPEKRLFVLAHEVWHNALLHVRRGEGRTNGELWNLAIDHEVNGLLRRDGFKMPPDAVHYEQWEGLPAEAVYEHLLREPDQACPRPRDADVHLGDTPPGPTGELDADVGPIKGKFDPAYPGRVNREEAEAWAERLVALGQALPGHLPGSLARAIQAVLAPEIPWQALLRDFLLRTSGGRLSWLPPARRHVHRGLYLPSRSGHVLRLALAVDTSGSVQEELPRFVTELRRILGAFDRYEVRLLMCDAAVQLDQRFEDNLPPPDRLEFRGGGGTDFNPVFRRLAPAPPDGLLFFTDGFAEVPREPPPYPVLWALTPEGRPPTIWGRVIRLNHADRR